jgi:hypothetical protein
VLSFRDANKGIGESKYRREADGRNYGNRVGGETDGTMDSRARTVVIGQDSVHMSNLHEAKNSHHQHKKRGTPPKEVPPIGLAITFHTQ